MTTRHKQQPEVDPLELLVEGRLPIHKPPTFCPTCGRLRDAHEPLDWLKHQGIIPERKKDDAA